MATDGDNNLRTGVVAVVVNVGDVEDSIPLFISTNYESSVLENLNGVRVLTVEVSSYWKQGDHEALISAYAVSGKGNIIMYM